MKNKSCGPFFDEIVLISTPDWSNRLLISRNVNKTLFESSHGTLKGPRQTVYRRLSGRLALKSSDVIIIMQHNTEHPRIPLNFLNFISFSRFPFPPEGEGVGFGIRNTRKYH